jgi:hypothetical protein
MFEVFHVEKLKQPSNSEELEKSHQSVAVKIVERDPCY